jgi:hypothetical protein
MLIPVTSTEVPCEVALVGSLRHPGGERSRARPRGTREAPRHAGRLAAAPFQNVSSSERVVAEQVHVRRVAARVDAVVERADSSERRNFGLRMI